MQELCLAIEQVFAKQDNGIVFDQLESLKELTLLNMKEGTTYYFEEFPQLVYHSDFGCKLREKLMEEIIYGKDEHLEIMASYDPV